MSITIVNETIAYIDFYRNRSNADALQKVALGFITPPEVSEAKQRAYIDPGQVPRAAQGQSVYYKAPEVICTSGPRSGT